MSMAVTVPSGGGQLRRLGERDRPVVTITIDGAEHEALAGDTLLTALLTAGHRVRESEFGDGPRAGFCWMAACQDCWVWLADGRRVRACSTPVEPGLSVLTRPAAPGDA